MSRRAGSVINVCEEPRKLGVNELGIRARHIYVHFGDGQVKEIPLVDIGGKLGTTTTTTTPGPVYGPHVLATTTGLGADHLVSGLTAGLFLQGTGATTAAFGVIQLAHLPIAPSDTLPLVTVAGSVGTGINYVRSNTVPGLAAGTNPTVHLAQNMIRDGCFSIVQGSPATMPFWGGATGPATIGRVVTDAYAGGACLEFSARTGAGNASIFYQPNNEPGYAEYQAVSAAKLYRAQLVVKRVGAADGNRVQLVIHCYDKDKVSTGTLTPIDVAAPATAWTLTQTEVGTGAFAWPAGTTYCRIEVRDASTGTGAVNLVGLAVFQGQGYAAMEDHPHGVGADGGALGTDVVDSAQIKALAVGTSELANLGVTEGKIAAGAQTQRMMTNLAGAVAWWDGVAIKAEDFEDVTDWTDVTLGTYTIEENPPGQLHLRAGDAAGVDSIAGKQIAALAPNCQQATLDILVKFDQLGSAYDGTAAKSDYFQVGLFNGAYQHAVYFTADSVWYGTAAGVIQQFTTAFDNASWYRFRIIFGPNYAMIWSSDDGAAWVYRGCCINATASTSFNGLLQMAVANYPTSPAQTEVHVDSLTLIAGHYAP